MTTKEEFLERNRQAALRSSEDFRRYKDFIEKEIQERGILLHHRLISDLNRQSLPRLFRVLKRVGASITFFTVLHYISRSFWRRAAPTTYYSLSKSDKISFPEKICSTFHGIVVSLWALKIVIKDGVFMPNRTLEWYPLDGDELYSFSLGYEIYDLFTMYFQGTSKAEMWAHHFSLISCYILEMWYRKVYSVTTTMMTTELTVVPANLHWYLKIFKLKNIPLFQWNQLLRLFLFCTLRVFAGPFVLHGIIVRQRKQYAFQHWFLKAIVYCFPIFLTYLNWRWTWTLLRIYYNKRRN